MCMATNTTTYSLPTLPYELDALAPVLSAELLDLHYNKHHNTYVKKANELVDSLASLPADADPSALLRALSFNVSGHALHSLFWQSMSPGSTKPTEALKAEITRSFGSEEILQARLTAAVAKLSGSGWGALVWEPIAKRLAVVQLHDHQSDFIVGATPLLVIDGWEHAYYLDYHADREAWAKKFLEVADWAGASKRYSALTQTTPKAAAAA
jgi:superoxide dismutase, Fe-Mn family